MVLQKSIIKKYNRLTALLKTLDSAVVAFSGGLDSGLLLKLCARVLGKRLVAVTAISPSYPSLDLTGAKNIAREIGVKHLVVKTGEFKNKNFIRNSRRRCYWCKCELFFKLKEIADRCGFGNLLDGTNYDDRLDHRPGLAANRKFKVLSPLYRCGLTKRDLRILSRFLGCSFWNKPSGTCLSSRIPFGEKITFKRIEKVEKAERILKDFFGGNALVRARDHRKILRIEVERKEWGKLKNPDIDKIVKKLNGLGYRYTTLDLQGYLPAGKRK